MAATKETLRTTNKSGKPMAYFSNQRKSMLQRTFDLFDTDKNGRISKEELKQHLSSLLCRKKNDVMTQEEVDYLMHVAFDEEEEIDLNDFMRGLQDDEEQDYASADDELLQVFQQLDQNGDGQLTREELRQGLEQRLGMVLTEEEWQNLRLDHSIDFEQFKSTILNL